MNLHADQIHEQLDGSLWVATSLSRWCDVQCLESECITPTICQRVESGDVLDVVEPCERCDGNGGFKVDSMILYGIPGGEDWGERCDACNADGLRIVGQVRVIEVLPIYGRGFPMTTGIDRLVVSPDDGTVTLYRMTDEPYISHSSTITLPNAEPGGVGLRVEWVTP